MTMKTKENDITLVIDESTFHKSSEFYLWKKFFPQLEGTCPKSEKDLLIMLKEEISYYSSVKLFDMLNQLDCLETELQDKNLSVGKIFKKLRNSIAEINEKNAGKNAHQLTFEKLMDVASHYEGLRVKGFK